MNRPDDETPVTPDRLEDQLTRALEAGAAAVRPDPDALRTIRARTAGSRRSWAVPLAVAATTAAVAVAGAVIVRGTVDGAAPPVAPATTTEATPAVTTPPTPTATQPPPSVTAPTEPDPTDTSASGTDTGITVPVYFLGAQPTETGVAYRLFREFHHMLREMGSGDWNPTDRSRAGRVTAAVQEILTSYPLDADYTSVWPPSAVINDVVVDEDSGIVTVDLGGLDWTGLDTPDGRPIEESGPVVLQQLVFTATAAASGEIDGESFSPRSVRVLVDGEPVDEILGVDTSAPLERDPASALALVWILDIVDEGATGVRVDVLANLFEGGPAQWELRRDGTVVSSGVSVGLGESARWVPYEVRLPDLGPGTYEVEVYDVGGLGERDRAPFDSKSFTVE